MPTERRAKPPLCTKDLERVAHKTCDNGIGNTTFFGLKRLPPTIPFQANGRPSPALLLYTGRCPRRGLRPRSACRSRSAALM